MKKLLTILGIIIVIIGIIFGGLIFAANKYTDPNRIKNTIHEVVYNKTGRELVVNGNVTWSFFPWVGIRVSDITLNNPKKFPDGNFAKIDELDFKFNVWTLISDRKFEHFFKRLVLKNATFTLIKNIDGSDNWEDLLAMFPKSATGQPIKIVPPIISDIDISNSTVDFVDQTNNETVKITNFNFQSKNLNIDGNPFTVLLSGNVDHKTPDTTDEGNLSLTGNFNVDFSKEAYSVKNLAIKGNILSDPLVMMTPFEIDADVTADFKNQTLLVDNLTTKFSSALAKGKVQVTNVFYAPKVAGNLTASAFDPKPLLLSFGLISKTNAIDNAKILPVLKNASFKIALQTTSKFLKIPTLELTFDDSVISGKADYSHFGEKFISFNLDINQLNLDQYLALLEAPKNNPPQPTTFASEENKLIGKVKKKISKNFNGVNKIANNKISVSNNEPQKTNSVLALLRQSSIDGDLKIGSFTFGKMHFDDVAGEVSGENGVITLKPLSFKFYQGNSRGSLSFDIKGTTPKYSAETSLTSVTVQSVLQDLLGSAKVSGILFANSKITAEGNSVNAILQSLNGKGNIHLNNGVFYGFDVRYQIERANALLNNRTVTVTESVPSKTSFGQLTGSFTLKNGLMSTSDLLVMAPDFKIKGSGSANLVTQTLNLLLEAYAKRNNFYVPIRVTNTFLNPTITPDLSLFVGKLLEGKVADEVAKRISDAKVSDKDKIQVEKGLKSLLKL